MSHDGFMYKYDVLSDKHPIKLGEIKKEKGRLL